MKRKVTKVPADNSHTDAEIRVKARVHNPNVMRLRTNLASGEHPKHGKFEVALCGSGVAIYVQSFGKFQYAIPLDELAAAVFSHMDGEFEIEEDAPDA